MRTNRLTFATGTSTGNTIELLSALLSLVILSSACDLGASSPTSATRPPTPTTTYTLSGTVSEMTADGSTPIQGARVASESGQAALTDANGLYSIPGLLASSRSVSISKGGYVTETRTVTLTADTQLDIRLERIASYVLSGVVFEITPAGQVPIEGVEVYCDSCGSPDGHTFVYTDASGFYSLAWTFNGVHPLFVTKAGYEIFDPTGTLTDFHGRISATVKGDTRVDIQLARR
jgi:hypothetical protein